MAPLLQLEQVWLSHWRGPREIPVLRDVSLVVEPGEMLAVWGRRGVGKTTLAMLAAGLAIPDRGRVVFAGSELSGPKKRRVSHVRDGIAWVHSAAPANQSDHSRVADLVSLPIATERHPARKAIAALDMFGVGDCAHATWFELTDGERQLVALARALVRNPRLLIADDPTSSLGVLERDEVMARLLALVREDGLSVLLTVPSLPEGLGAHRIASLGEGRLLVSGESTEADGVPPAPEKVVPLRRRSA